MRKIPKGLEMYRIYDHNGEFMGEYLYSPKYACYWCAGIKGRTLITMNKYHPIGMVPWVISCGVSCGWTRTRVIR